MPPTKRGRGASAPARPQDIIPLGRGNAPQPQSVQRRATPSTPALTPLGNKQIPPILPEGEDVVNTILELDAKQEIDKKAQLIENILDWLCQKIIVNMNTERYDTMRIIVDVFQILLHKYGFVSENKPTSI